VQAERQVGDADVWWVGPSSLEERRKVVSTIG
jgi:hypothetical protein